ncbi:hypothetical protein F5Y10DRAFT_270350 [Nemania abortiva]|nr:hypothetical protein F5Y10DRAFT_270350 [Nemania abortiva]
MALRTTKPVPNHTSLCYYRRRSHFAKRGSAKNENANVTRLMEQLNNSTETALYVLLPSTEFKFCHMDHDRRRRSRSASNVDENILLSNHATSQELPQGCGNICTTILNRRKGRLLPRTRLH